MKEASLDRKMKERIESYVRNLKKQPHDHKSADELDPLNDGCGLDLDDE